MRERLCSRTGQSTINPRGVCSLRYRSTIDLRPTSSVSVIIAAFNAAEYLVTAVSSVLDQAGVELEVIIVDDASTDDTSEVIRRLASGDRRVKPIFFARNSGPSVARNAGIESAQNDWIAILDADDYFREGRLLRLSRHAETLRADLVADNQQVVDYDTGALISLAFPSEWLDEERPLTLAELVRRDTPRDYPLLPLGYMKPLIRRHFLLRENVRYPPEHSIGEDFLFYVRCVAAGGRLLLVKECDYVSRRRSKSLSRSDDSIHTRQLALNAQVIREVSESHPTVQVDLTRRHQALKIELFRHEFRQRRWLAALRVGLSVKPKYFLERIKRALAGRLATPTRQTKRGAIVQ